MFMETADRVYHAVMFNVITMDGIPYVIFYVPYQTL